MKIKQNIILGIFFFFLQVLIIIFNWNKGIIDVFLWYCNHAPILFAIGLFLEKKRFLQALLNMGLLGQLGWALDFFSKLLFDTYLFGITRYMFEDPFSLALIISIPIHFLSTFLVILYTYKNKPDSKVLIESIIYMFFLFIFSLILTQPTYNINCVYEAGCGLNFLENEFYTYLWPFLTILIIIIPTHYLQFLIYKFSLKSKKKKS